jgi:hypothetical protein
MQDTSIGKERVIKKFSEGIKQEYAVVPLGLGREGSKGSEEQEVLE